MPSSFTLWAGATCLALWPATACLSAEPATQAAEPPLPAQVRVSPGRMFTLVAKSEGEVVWDFPPEFVDVGRCGDGRTVFVVAPASPGEWVVRLASVADGKPRLTRCVVTADNSPNPSPNPNPPNPQPTPPPPQPTPVPPADPLAAELQAIYLAEVAPNKREVAKSLASLYRQASAYADDQDLATVGQYGTVVREAGNTLVGGGLTAYRRRVGAEIAKVLGTDPDAPFRSEQREAAKRLFLRLGQITEQLAK